MNIFNPAKFQRRTAALIALGVALLVQLIWFAREVLFSQTTLADLTQPIVGLKVRFAAAASGLLFFLFATAMTISGLEQFTWAVYVLATGGWMLSTVDASMLSLDGLFFTKRKETSWKSPVATR